MKNKLTVMLVSLMMPLVASAGINVTWSIGYGVYPVGAPDLEAANPGSGFLAGGGSSLMQLIWTPTATYLGPDFSNSGGNFLASSSDHAVLQSRTVTAGVGGYDEWGYNSTLPSAFTDPIFSAGSVFMRVFGSDSPSALNNTYFDSQLLVLQDRGPDITATQFLYLETGSAAFPTEGVALIPEPSVLALLGIGGMVVAIRRRKIM